MVDLDAYEPWLVAFFVLAAVTTFVSVVVLVLAIVPRRRPSQLTSLTTPAAELLETRDLTRSMEAPCL